MENPPKVTVFMALYNNEKYVGKSIESILNQTFKDFELLIINDGSTDKSIEIVNSFNDSRIRLINNTKNQGIRYTRQEGLIKARANYIAILDSDDVAMPNRIGLQYDYLSKNPDYAICGSNAELINNNDESLFVNYVHNHENEKIKIELLFGNQFVNSSVMIDRKKAILIGGYNSLEIAEDYELFIKMAKKNYVTNIDSNLIQYRLHDTNISKLKLDQIRKAELAVLKIAYQEFNIDDSLLQVPHIFFTNQYYNVRNKDINLFFNSILKINTEKKIYPVSLFNQIVFKKWQNLIFHKKSKTIALKVIKNSNFRFSKLNAKEKRRLLKILLNPFI